MGIARVEVGGDEERLRRRLGSESQGLEVRWIQDEPGPRRAAVATEAGELIFASAGADRPGRTSAGEQFWTFGLPSSRNGGRSGRFVP